MDVLAVCPMLISQNTHGTCYEGLLSAGGDSFHIRVELKGKNSLKNASIECEWRLKQLLHGYDMLLQQRLQQSKDLASFLVELTSIVENRIKNRVNQEKTLPTKLCSALVDEIEILGWEKLVYVDTSFQQLHLQANDDKSRCHVLKLVLHEQHPLVAPSCTTELPTHVEFGWSPKHTITDLYNQFKKQLSLYEDFWDMMDDIDKSTWVIEPEKPTRNATGRRMALGGSASVQIEVDPRHPRMLPECRFLGADHVVNPLRDSLNSNLHQWDPNQTLLSNLQTVLQTTFPSPTETKKEDFSVECGICYAYRLDGQIPDQVCDDARCGQPFHHVCLYEWLRALPSSRQSFNTVFGECPYCNKAITVKMPTR